MDIPNYEDFLKQIKTNLWFVGAPYENSNTYLRYYVCFTLLFLILIEETAFMVSKVNKVNMLDITQLAPCLGIGVLSVLKFVAVFTKRRKIFNLVQSLQKIYEIIRGNDSKKHLVGQNYINLNILIKYFFTLNAILISVYNFATPIFILYIYYTTNTVEFILPYAVLLPFEVNSWSTWIPVYLHSIIAGFICVMYFTSVDVLYCTLTTHVCSYFATISDRIKDLDETNTHLIRDIVRDHQFALQLSEDLEYIFTAANLFNVLIGSLEICALGFNLTMGEMRQMPGCALFLASVLIQILMMSVFGENLITESTKIGEMAYNCKWYNMDQRSKKIMLTMMIITSLKPQRLTAYKFSVISYGSFTKIISTSWSYFTILRSVYIPPEANSDITNYN